MANVGEIFSRFFAYVLLFEESTQQGRPQRSYEQIRNDLAAIIEQQKAAARRQGMSEQDYQNACFAAVAWADETILKNSNWEHHNRWRASPLQLEYFQTRNAGEELFERLERLRQDQQDIREIYYLALGLGFTGQYFLGLEDELKLSQIRHEQAKHLPLLVEDLQDIDKLTPQPYEIASPTGKPIARPLTHLLLKLGLVLLVVVPLALFVAYKLWQPSAPPSPLNVADIQRLIGDQPCANIAVSLQGRVVDLGGRVASEAQRAEVTRRVQGMRGVSQVHETLQIIPRPLCDVLDVLEPLRQQSQAQELGLAADLNKPGEHPTYVGGDYLVVDVKTPTKFDSYVYVDYYTASGDVGHLFPNPTEPRNVFRPGSVYTVGKQGDPQRLEWRIQPPFGLELVAVMASKTPLFSTPRYAPEETQAYLKELQRVLPRDISQGEVAVTFYLITTQQAQ